MSVGKIAAIILGLVVLVVVALGGVLASLDFNDMKGLVAERVKAATGRQLIMAGDVDPELSLSPSLTLRDVSFENAAWGSRPEMAKLKHFSAEVALLPLISGNLEVKRLVLDGLDLILESDAKGRGNWLFEAGGQAAGEATEGGALPKFDNVLVKNITIVWRDGGSDESREIKLAKFEAKAAEAGRIALSFAASLAGQAVSGSGRVGALQRLGEGQPYPVALDLEAAGAKIKIAGSIAKPLEGAGLDFQLEVAGRDLGALGAALGAELPLGGPYALKTGLGGSPAKLTLHGLVLELAGSDLAGSLNLDLSGPRPGLTGKLAAKLIDLTPLMPASPAKAAKPAKPGDRVFPDDPLPLDVLALVDFDLSLSAKTVKARKLVLNDLALELRNGAGKAEFTVKKARLDKARLSARLALSGLAARPRVSSRFQAKALDIGKLLKDLEISDLLALSADASADLSGQGRSLRALMAGLDGKELVAGKGSVASEYVDLIGADLIGELMPWNDKKTQTEINCVVARWDVKQGMATLTGLLADTGKVTVTGKGKIDLGKEALDLTVRPRPKQASLLSLAAPIDIGGTLAQPSFGLNKAAVAVGVAGLVAGTAINPLGLLIPLVSGGTGEANPCAEAVSGKGGKAAKAGAKARPAGAASGSEAAKPGEKSGGLGGLLKGLGDKLKSVVQPQDEKRDP